MAKLLSATSKNGIQKTLAAELLSTASTGDAITFADVDGIPNLPGVLVIDRIDSAGTATPAKREYIEYSGTSGTTVLITTRNVDSSGTVQTHAVGAIVEFVPDVVWADRIYDALSNIVNVNDVSALASGITLSSPSLISPNIPLSTGWFNSSGATITGVIDDDTMATASATTLATSESTKAYVDIKTVKMKAYLSANTGGLTNGTATIMPLNTEVYDTGSDFNTTTYKFVAPVTGYYLVNGAVTFQPSVVDKRYFAMVFVGANEMITGFAHSSLINIQLTANVSGMLYLQANDEVTLYGRSDSGDNNTIVIGAVERATRLDITLLSL